MSRCFLWVCLLVFVQLGQTEKNVTDIPTTTTSSQPGFFRRALNSLNSIGDFVRGVKPEDKPTNSSLHPPSSTSKPTGEVQDVLHLLESVIIKRNSSNDGNVERDAKCLPPEAVVNLQPTVNSDNNTLDLLNELVRIFAETNNLTSEFLNDIASPNTTVTLSNGSSVNGAFLNGSLLNSTGIETDDVVLRIGKELSDLDVTHNDSASLIFDLEVYSKPAQHNKAKPNRISVESLNKTKHYRISNKTKLGANQIPRALFTRYFGIGKNHSLNGTERISRYLAENATHDDRLNRYLTLVRKHNWTYNGFARSLNNLSDAHRTDSDLKSRQYDYYPYYYDYNYGDYYDYEFRSEKRNATENTTSDTIVVARHENINVTDPVARLHIPVDVNVTDNVTDPEARDSISGIIIMFNFTFDTPERDARMLELFNENVSTSDNSSVMFHNLLLSEEVANVTVKSNNANFSDIPISRKIEDGVSSVNTTSNSDALVIESNFSSVNVTSSSGNLVVFEVRNTENNATNNNTTPKWGVLSEISPANETNIEFSNETSVNVIPKKTELSNETDVNVIPKEIAELLNETQPKLSFNESDLSARNANESAEFEVIFSESVIEVGNNDTETYDLHSRDNDGNSSGMMLTVTLDNSTHNESTANPHNITEDDLRLILQFLKGNLTENTTDDYSNNTTIGHHYDPHLPNNQSDSDIVFHLKGDNSVSSRMNSGPRVNWYNQPPFVWHPPSQGFRIYLPTPLEERFRPHFPQNFPHLKLVCPTIPTVGCPPYVGMRKCYVPTDCPRKGQLCCRVGCGVECIDGILVPIRDHFY